jgi:phospholipid transport system substrate-binding protein
LARDLDIPLIGRFVMGRHWQRASEEQRITFMKVFRSYVVHTYAARLGGAEVDEISIINTKVVGKKDILVRSKVVNTNLKPIRADWRLRQRDGTYRIFDLSVEGISMALTLRQEFGAILRKQGGVDNLIDFLKKRNA